MRSGVEAAESEFMDIKARTSLNLPLYTLLVKNRKLPIDDRKGDAAGNWAKTGRRFFTYSKTRTTGK